MKIQGNVLFCHLLCASTFRVDAHRERRDAMRCDKTFSSCGTAQNQLEPPHKNTLECIVTSADEVEKVMFSVPCVCMCVCLSVCLLTAYSPQFYCNFVQNFRQVSSLPRIEMIKFWTLTSLTLTLTFKVKTTILLQCRSKFQTSFVLA